MVVVIVAIDFDQGAVADLVSGAAQLIQLGVVGLADGEGSSVLAILGGVKALAVDIQVGSGVLGGHVQVSIDVIDLLRADIGQVRSLGIGADLDALVIPAGSGTAESVRGAVGKQVLEHGLIIRLILILNSLGAGGNGDVANDDSVVIGIREGAGLQHVQGIQAGLFTSGSLGAVELALQAVIQSDVLGQSALGNGDGPVGAGVAFLVSLQAQSAQQHLHESIAGQGVGGTEGAVSITGDDALLSAVSDVGSKDVGSSNVLVGSCISGQSVSSGGAQDQVADDLGGSTAGQSALGIEGAIGITTDDAQGGHHFDSFFIVDLAVVGEVLGASADGDQRHGHHQSQNQRKELLHGVSSF